MSRQKREELLAIWESWDDVSVDVLNLSVGDAIVMIDSVYLVTAVRKTDSEIHVTSVQSFFEVDRPKIVKMFFTLFTVLKVLKRPSAPT